MVLQWAGMAYDVDRAALAVELNCSVNGRRRTSGASARAWKRARAS